MKSLDKISFYIFLATVFLMPLFYVPAAALSISAAKGIVFSLGVVLSIIFWLIARLVEGRITLPKNLIFIAGIILVLAYTLSAIFSPSKSVSMFGLGFEMGTCANIVLLVISMFLASVFAKEKNRGILMFFGIFLSFVIISIISLISLYFGPGSVVMQYLPFGAVGSLNDFSIFSGLIAIMSILALQFLSLNKVLKAIVILTGLLSLFFMIILGYYTVWIVVGIAAFLVFVYGLSLRRSASVRSKEFPTAPFVVMAFSIVFLATYSIFGVTLPSKFRINNLEVRPSFSSTLEVTSGVLSQNPILGFGPGRFSNAWLLYKPVAINESDYWDSNFNLGYSFLFSTPVNVGILGFFAWIFLLAVVVIKTLFKIFFDKYSGDTFVFWSSILGSLYLIVFALLYAPSVAVIFLLFILFGIFTGISSADKKSNIEFEYLKDPRLAFFTTVILVIFISAIFLLGYIVTKKISAAVIYSQAVSSPNTEQGLIASEKKIIRALSLDESDIYLRAISQMYLVKADALAKSNPQGSEKLIQELLTKSLQASNSAVLKDQTNYLNWLSLGVVYESALSLKLSGAYEGAKSSYTKAIELNPKNPGLYMILARLELSANNKNTALGYIRKALELKTNYKDAINALEYFSNLSQPKLSEELPVNVIDSPITTEIKREE